MTAPVRQITSRDVLAYRITAPHFSCGFILHQGQVRFMQTPVKFMAGWSLWQVIKYCDWRGWIFEQTEVPVS